MRIRPAARRGEGAGGENDATGDRKLFALVVENEDVVVHPDVTEPVIGRRFAPTRWLHPGYELRPLLQLQPVRLVAIGAAVID